jgi:hypothetical protein
VKACHQALNSCDFSWPSVCRPLLDLRVSIQGGVHFDLLKRVLRDISRSGQNPEEIIDQVSATVFPMFRVGVGLATCLLLTPLVPGCYSL